MALICPLCQAPESIAYVENEDGKTPYACLICERYPTRATPYAVVTTDPAPCISCGGPIVDTYRYGATGYLTDIHRTACPRCGRDRTVKEKANASDNAERALPYPRL
ncbi:hypothetical protein [Streptomyces sp. SID3212]|uniref:hypothetical protein n=1 Tax=Streptomyces sp. SID3212 TaxID=2690259 RepID=UPI0013698B69|nr:hypothetical protein [Streptomyces sp. SID3212]MYV56491.1 hypothetical protein [Streptomyces sp. SID3212]